MGFSIGAYYFPSILSFLCFLTNIFIAAGFGFLSILLLSKAIHKVHMNFSVSYNNKHYLLGIIALSLLNYPLYLLIDVFQSSANTHIEPPQGDITAYFLAGVLLYTLRLLIKRRRVIIATKLLSIFCIELIVMLIFWIIRYHGMSCSVCSSGI